MAAEKMTESFKLIIQYVVNLLNKNDEKILYACSMLQLVDLFR